MTELLLNAMSRLARLELQSSQFSEFIRVDNNSKSLSAVLITIYSAIRGFCYLRLKCYTRYLCVCFTFFFMKVKCVVNEHGLLSYDPFELGFANNKNISLFTLSWTPY